MCSCLRNIVEKDLILEEGNRDSIKSWLVPTQPTPFPYHLPLPYLFILGVFQALGTQGGGTMSLKAADPLLYYIMNIKL